MKFGTAINCIDGRAQIPVINYFRENFGVEYVDMITEPGADGVVSSQDDEKLRSMREKVRISVERHNSKVIAVVGHFDCAGNPVDEKTHIKQIEDGVKKILGWGFEVDVVGLWIDENFNVRRVC